MRCLAHDRMYWFGLRGRVNLIGEHIDYNSGFVLPASIDKEIQIAIGFSNESSSTLHALDFGESFQFDVRSFGKSEKKWTDYVLGVVAEIQKLGHNIAGFNMVFGGNIPTGAGLSSSAAVECGTAFALDSLFKLGLEKRAIALLSQRAENKFVGVNCGIMDQYASTFGKIGQVIKLDCNSVEHVYFPFRSDGIDILLCDTGVKHSLGDSEYNTRRLECEAALAAIKQRFPEISTFREVGKAHLAAVSDGLPPKTVDRAYFVIEEIERVNLACDLLQQNNLQAFGQLMFQAHEGLSKLYEVSCLELDFLKDLAVSSGVVLGSRMMGGGFGGCTINLLPSGQTESFISKATESYFQAFGRELKTYKVAITDGVSLA